MLHRDEPYLERMIGLQHGRVYYQLDAWYRLHSRLAVFPLFKSAWETMMGLEPSAGGPRPGLARLALRLALPLARAAHRVLTHDRAMAEFEAGWEAVIRPRRGRDWSALEPLARIEDFHAVWRAASDLWGVTLINDSVLSTHASVAKKLLDRWLPDGDPALLSDLLCDSEDNQEVNHSVAIVLSTVRLAEQVRACPDLLADVEAGDVERVWARLDAGEYGTELGRAFRLHLHRYGDRGLQELKMEQPNPRHTPWELLALTAQYARSDLTADGLRDKERGIRAAAERRLELALGPRSVRLLVLRSVLGRLRRGVRYRENSRYCRSEWFGVAKEIFASLGADLAARGVLRDAADVVHLTQEELFGWYDGTGVSAALQPLADARRAEFESPGPELPMRFTTLGTVPASRSAGLAGVPAVEPDATPGGGELRGLGSSRGTVRGTARVVLDPRHPGQTLPPGAILIAKETDPGWLFLMLRAAGIVVERGTMLSHTAITGRKFGIPTVVGLTGASTLIPDGALVEMDGTTGRVTILAVP
jgi:rifampicin phosphotransferase